jgi:hypothetical protein
VTPQGPSAGRTRENLAGEVLVERLNKGLPPLGGLAGGEVAEDPLPFLRHVGLHDLTEPDAGVASDLLNSALVQRRDGVLRGPVAWRRIGEDALLAVVVEEFDDELVLLVAHGAVRKQLKPAGNELGELRLGLEIVVVVVAGGVGAPHDVAEQLWLRGILDVASDILVRVVVLFAGLGGGGDEGCVISLARVENALVALHGGCDDDGQRRLGGRRLDGRLHATLGRHDVGLGVGVVFGVGAEFSDLALMASASNGGGGGMKGGLDATQFELET